MLHKFSKRGILSQEPSFSCRLNPKSGSVPKEACPVFLRLTRCCKRVWLCLQSTGQNIPSLKRPATIIIDSILHLCRLILICLSCCRGMQAAEEVYNIAKKLSAHAMLLAFDEYQSLVKRYARVPDWQKPVPRDEFTPGTRQI